MAIEAQVIGLISKFRGVAEGNKTVAPDGVGSLMAGHEVHIPFRSQVGRAEKLGEEVEPLRMESGPRKRGA